MTTRACCAMRRRFTSSITRGVKRQGHGLISGCGYSGIARLTALHQGEVKTRAWSGGCRPPRSSHTSFPGERGCWSSFSTTGTRCAYRTSRRSLFSKRSCDQRRCGGRHGGGHRRGDGAIHAACAFGKGCTRWVHNNIPCKSLCVSLLCLCVSPARFVRVGRVGMILDRVCLIYTTAALPKKR